MIWGLNIPDRVLILLFVLMVVLGPALIAIIGVVLAMAKHKQERDEVDAQEK